MRREAQDTLVQRRAVTRLRVEMALQKEGRLRRRLRAGLILRRMTLHDTQGWKRTVFKTALVLRSLPFVAKFLAVIMRDRYSIRRHN